MSVPLRSEYAATVRMVAASLGADAGFSVDELDDVRLALSEVFSALADGDRRVGNRAHVTFAVSEATIRIEVSTRDGDVNVELDDLALGILRSVTDEFEVTSDAVKLVKRATEAATHPSAS